MKIHFLYGSQSGTAEYLADTLMDSASATHDCEVSSLDQVDPSDLNSDTFYVLVSATFGSGQLPDSAQAFYDALENQHPDLSGVRFAIFGLGDQSFGETFNNGSKLLMTQMQACGAQLIGERGLHNASSSDVPQKIALPWLKGILAQVGG